MAGRKLTDAETKALDEADSILERAFNEAAGKVRIIREGSNNSFAHCLRCDCEYFVTPTHSGSVCGRPTCRHPFFSHDVF